MKDTEILIHVSAPGGVRDDSRYRTQVQAILDFEAVSRQAVFHAENLVTEEVVASHASSGEDSGPLNSGDELESVNPAAHRVDKGLKGVSADVLEPQLRASLEVVSISSPDLLEIAAREEEDAVTGDKPVTDKEARECSSSSSRQLPPPQGTPSPSLPSRESTPWDSPLRVIPDSQPASERPDLSDPVSREHEQVETPSERKRRQHSAVENPVAEASIIIRSRSQRDHKTPPNLASSCHPIPGPTHSISLSSLPLEIHPPPPPVSTEKFQTHITPTLQMLAERLKFSRRFTPVKQSRDLDRLERGHWFFRLNVLEQDIGNNGDKRVLRQSENMVNAPPPGCKSGCSNRATWPYPFFAQFWSFLNDIIARDGRAGWGVWCILEKWQTPDHRDHSGFAMVSRLQLTDPSEQCCHGQHSEFGIAQPLTMKVYAWGEIATHIYLLLFLASERRIRGMQAQWRDSAENVVIQMP